MLERGLFDTENTLPEELTLVQMGKIVRDRYPELSKEDQESVRQQAVAALCLAQQGREIENGTGGGEGGNGVDNDLLANIPTNTALIMGVRKFVNVRDLNIDLIDSINPFDSAYAILSRAMDEKTFRQVQAIIAKKRLNIPYDEARELALRAHLFKNERGRAPVVNSSDPWEIRMAEGVAAFARYVRERAQNQKQTDAEANHD